MTKKTQLAWAAVVAVMVVLPVIIAVAAAGDPAVETVEDYLNAVRDKDVDEALRIADRQSVNRDDPLRSAAALSSDWQIESVKLRSEPGIDIDDDEEGRFPYLVDAVIRSGDETSRGVFRVTRRETDDGRDTWRIHNPFVDLKADPEFLDYVELNGAVVEREPPVTEAEEDGDEPEIIVRAFPGLYRPFTKDPNASATPERLLVLPNGQDGEAQIGQLDLSLSISPEGTEAIDTAVREHIDDCVARDKPTLTGCPYVATDEVREVSLGTESYNDVEDITWKVDEYPETIPADSGDGFGITANNGPAVTMKATGKRSSDGSRVAFSATCPLDLDGTGTHYISPRATAKLSRSGKATVSWEIGEFDDSVFYECH